MNIKYHFFSSTVTKVFSALFLLTLVCNNANAIGKNKKQIIDCSKDGGGTGIKFTFYTGPNPVISQVTVYKKNKKISSSSANIDENCSWSTLVCPDDQIAPGTDFLAYLVPGKRCWNFHINKNAKDIKIGVKGGGTEATTVLYSHGATMFKGVYNYIGFGRCPMQ